MALSYLYHFVSAQVCSLWVGTLCVGSMPAASQRAGAVGEMTAFSELSYLINSFITRLFEKAIPSV